MLVFSFSYKYPPHPHPSTTATPFYYSLSKINNKFSFLFFPLDMSIICCFLLFFLCIFTNACHARLLGAEKKFHLSNKNNDESMSLDKISALSNEKASMSGELEAAKGGNDKIEENAVQKKNDASRAEMEAGKISDHGVQKESVGSFSWKVPRTEPSDKHPGFNLDYSPPKTHPPSHN